MIELDNDILEDLVQTVDSLKKEMEVTIKFLVSDPSKSNLYEEYGQQIDRIYGTVSTIGIDNLGNYTLLLKKIGYACSQYKGEEGRKETIELFIKSIETLDYFIYYLKNLGNEDLQSMLDEVVDEEIIKAEKLVGTVFKDIQRTTTAK